MKKLLLSIALLTLFLSVSAQEPVPEMKHVSYEPLVFEVNSGIVFDFDNDSVLDLEMTINTWNYELAFALVSTFFNGTSWSQTPWNAKAFHYGDTLLNSTTPWSILTRRFAPGEVCVDGPFYAGIRKPVDGGYCYGWISYSFDIDEAHLDDCWLILHEYVYCNVPNYPLRIGQTSFNWNMEENQADVFASIYPNPAKHRLSIEGNNLRDAELFSMTGQRLATGQFEGGSITMDLTDLSPGLYLVRITDEDGRNSIQKLVKE